MKTTDKIKTGAATALGGQAASMGIATTFGTTSTGTAISPLSETAATNVATAWLGGETLTAGVVVWQLVVLCLLIYQLLALL